MITTVVFDIGNVLVDFDRIAYLTGLFHDEETVDRVDHAIFRTGYWDDLDRGEDTDETFARMLEAEPGYEDQIRQAFDEIGACTVRCDYAIPWIRALKKRGLRVLYLSNYSPHTMQSNPGALDFVPFMDGGIFSCDVRINKPDPAIYRLLIKKYDLVPEECIYLDDKQVNVDAAKETGMSGIVFRNYDFTKAELDWEIGKSKLMAERR